MQGTLVVEPRSFGCVRGEHWILLQMIWHDLRGHHEQLEMFRRAVGRGRTSSAYLFIGPRGIGKKEFARRIAQSLFCKNVPDAQLDACGQCSACKQVKARTHPDLLEIGCPEGKKELPIELIVGAPERRGREGLCHDLSLRPLSADRRIAIIDDAELMNEASANALLKTLEEPPPGTVLFLLTPEIEPILPTIRSRCQPLRFSPLSPRDVAEMLVKTGATGDAKSAGDIASLAEGSLETAQELLEPELRELRQTLHVVLARWPVNGLDLAARLNELLEKAGGETADHRRRARWILHFSIDHLRSQLAGTTEPQHLECLDEMLERCLQAELHLKQFMPVPLCLDGLCDALARISRQQY